MRKPQRGRKMKKLIITLLILLSSPVIAESYIEGDTNGDGVLSGSEQYLYQHPDDIEIDLSRDEIAESVRIAQQEKDANYAAAEQNRVQAKQLNEALAQQQAAIDRANKPKPIFLHSTSDGLGGTYTRGRY